MNRIAHRYESRPEALLNRFADVASRFSSTKAKQDAGDLEEQGRPSTKKALVLDLFIVLGLFLIALYPRWNIAQDYSEPPQSEERLYDRYAVPYAQGEGTEPREKAFPWHPYASVTHRPPGYIMFLGGVYRFAGIQNYGALRSIQAVLDSLSVVMLYWIGILIFGRGLAGRGVGATAGLLMAQYDFMMLFVARLLSETVFIWLSLAFIGLALLAIRREKPWLSFAAALVLGFCNLTRPFMIFVLPGYVLWLFMAPRLADKRKHIALAIAGMVLAIAPVTIRNWQFHDKLILISTNSGFTLYHSVTKVEGLEAPDEITEQELIKDLGLGEIEEQAAFRNVALDYMRNHPNDIPKIYLRKLNVLRAALGGHKISHVLMVTPR